MSVLHVSMCVHKIRERKVQKNVHQTNRLEIRKPGWVGWRAKGNMTSFVLSVDFLKGDVFLLLL